MTIDRGMEEVEEEGEEQQPVKVTVGWRGTGGGRADAYGGSDSRGSHGGAYSARLAGLLGFVGMRDGETETSRMAR